MLAMSPTSRLFLTPGLLLVLLFGCGKSGSSSAVIRNEGSDTMVNIAQAWAEQYHKGHHDVWVQVLGGGSGVGIASLTDGNCDMANTSRKMKEAEIEEAEKHRGETPQEIIVGHDALAICVHKQNPLDSIALEDLANLYGEDGKITKWSELGVPPGTLRADAIVRVNRQSGSGTYVYFREAVLGKGKDLKLGSVDANGSKDAVSLVSRTPSAIGYSGMGYITPEVKTLKVSKRRGEPGVAPTVENVRNGTYPIARPLQIYVLGEPAGKVKDYLDWILSPEGQKIVLDLGYVPLEPGDNPTTEKKK